MNSETLELAWATLYAGATPLADAANDVGTIMGMSTPASTVPLMSWASWVKRLDGRGPEDPTYIDLKEWIVNQQLQWPTTDTDVLGDWWAFWRNELRFAVGAQRRPGDLKGFFPSKPGLEAACVAYTPHLNVWASEIWFAIGWLGRYRSILDRAAAP